VCSIVSVTVEVPTPPKLTCWQVLQLKKLHLPPSVSPPVHKSGCNCVMHFMIAHVCLASFAISVSSPLHKSVCIFVLNICLSTSSVGCLAVHHHNMFVYIIFFGSLACVRNGDILFHMLSRIIFFSLFEQSAKCGICNNIVDSVQTQESSRYLKHCNSFVKFCLS
jgi:hypothetical protein